MHDSYNNYLLYSLADLLFYFAYFIFLYSLPVAEWLDVQASN